MKKLKLVPEYINDELFEERFSEDKISFNQQDIMDKALDAKFYCGQIKDNFNKNNDSSKDFNFDLAFEKLAKSIQHIIDSTELEDQEK